MSMRKLVRKIVRIDIEIGGCILVKCDYCGNTIAVPEEYCPTCGSRLAALASGNQSNTNLLRRKLLYVFVLVILISSIGIRILFVSNQFTGKSAGKTDPVNSIQTYMDDIRKDPKDMKARKGLAEAYLIQQADMQADKEIDNWIALDSKNPAIYMEAVELLIKYNRRDRASQVLVEGYAKTKDAKLQQQLRNVMSPEQALAEAGMKQAMELILGKPIGEITWEEMDKFKYFQFSNEGIRYSFEDSSTFADKDEFDKTVRQVVLDKPLARGDDFALFSNLTELRLSTGINVLLADLQKLPGLKRLSIPSVGGINDLTRFAAFDNLEELSIGGRDIASLEGISQMKKLKKIGLSHTSITNLSMLSTVKSIEAVALIDNDKLTGLDTLGAMTYLKELSLEGDKVTNLYFIANLKNLERLAIEDTPVKDVSFFSSLQGLKYLYFNNNDNVSDIHDMANLHNLEQLVLDAGDVESLSALSGMTNLRKLKLTGSDSLSPLSKMTQLQVLDLSASSGVRNLAPLSRLTELTELNLSNNNSNIEDLSPILKLRKLRSLNLSKNDLYPDISQIGSLASLEELDLSESHINLDVSQLTALKALKSLNLNNSKLIRNVLIESDGFITAVDYDEKKWDDSTGFLGQITGLEHLEIAQNEISTLAFIKGLQKLNYLNVQDNNITDISAAADLPGLELLNISANPVKDASPLEKMPNTKVIGG